MTMKMFAAEPEPAFETHGQLERVWGRRWGCDNDVGCLRVVLVHRPGREFEVVDPTKRIESIGSFGDPEQGWYWQSEAIPPLAEMQAQHDVLTDALRAEGVEVIRLDLGGYDIHIDGAFVMVDAALALLDASRLPHWFPERLRRLGIRCIEIGPDDSSWIVNCLAVRPRRILAPEGASARTLEALERHAVERVTVPCDRMHLNGGGIHCSTCPLVRDPLQ